MKNKKYSELGKIGGNALFKKVGKKGMSERGKKGMASRWARYRALKLSTVKV